LLPPRLRRSLNFASVATSVGMEADIFCCVHKNAATVGEPQPVTGKKLTGPNNRNRRARPVCPAREPVGTTAEVFGSRELKRPNKQPDPGDYREPNQSGDLIRDHRQSFAPPVLAPHAWHRTAKEMPIVSSLEIPECTAWKLVPAACGNRVGSVRHGACRNAVTLQRCQRRSIRLDAVHHVA
jgi:hypothetical protein